LKAKLEKEGKTQDVIEKEIKKEWRERSGRKETDATVNQVSKYIPKILDGTFKPRTVSAGVKNVVKQMKGETANDDNSEQAQDIFDALNSENISMISGNDAYNIRWWTVEIKNLPSLFYVMLPIYRTRGEPDPKYEYFDDHFEIIYTFKARDASKVYRLLDQTKLIPNGYQIAVEASIVESNVRDPQECHIYIQYPFKNGVSDRKHATDKSGSWEFICFQERVEQKSEANIITADLDID